MSTIITLITNLNTIYNVFHRKITGSKTDKKSRTHLLAVYKEEMDIHFFITRPDERGGGGWSEGYTHKVWGEFGGPGKIWIEDSVFLCLGWLRNGAPDDIIVLGDQSVSQSPCLSLTFITFLTWYKTYRTTFLV